MGLEVLAGAVVSFIVQLAKKWFGTNFLGSLALFFVVSGIGAAAFVWLQGTAYLETALKVGAYASLIYTVILRAWEKSQEA